MQLSKNAQKTRKSKGDAKSGNLMTAHTYSKPFRKNITQERTVRSHFMCGMRS